MKNTIVSTSVDYKGDNCNDEKEYLKDFCVDNAIEKQTLDKVGCTTPYGPNKNQTCSNTADGNDSYQIYHDEGTMFWDSSNSSKECLNPCSIFTFSIEESAKLFKTNNNSIIDISFEKFIKVTKEYYIYTGINLIAEIGGYVGLFLGISINQVINLIDFIVAKIEQFHDIFKK